jgi:hypothetical protein
MTEEQAERLLTLMQHIVHLLAILASPTDTGP